MAKKGKSEKKKDWLGREYIQHYDAQGNKSGRSERKESIFGKKYTQHYDSGGNKTGRSERKETVSGKQYTQKYNSRGDKSGTVERKTTLFGKSYTQHYDAAGNKTDRTERKRTMFGKKYVQRYGSDESRPSRYWVPSSPENVENGAKYARLQKEIALKDAGKVGVLSGFIALLMLWIIAQVVLAVSHGASDPVQIDRNFRDPMMRSPGMVLLATIVFAGGYILGGEIYTQKKARSLQK